MHTSLKLVAVAAVTTLMLTAVVACGKKDDGKGGPSGDKASETTTTAAGIGAAKASCSMLSELGTCNEYRTGSSFGLEKSLCEGFKGKFTNAGCSTEGQIGSCLMSEGEVKRYYGSKAAGDRALTASEAKSDCESELVKGKFTVDPNAAAANLTAPEDPKPVAAAKAAPAKAASAPKAKNVIKKK